MPLHPSLLDSVRGDSKNCKRVQMYFGVMERKAKGEGSQEGEEITSEFSGDTQQRAGEETFREKWGTWGH